MKTTEAHAKNTKNNFLMLKTLNLYFPGYVCYSMTTADKDNYFEQIVQLLT